ncbi:MAG: M48 family metalloprotease [Gammaproteobacteria bacterium]|nr:M48 family metalloprotease [Gammaproteobacteria bacterium]
MRYSVFFVLVLFALGLPSRGYASQGDILLPDIGGNTSRMSVEEEQRLGEEFMRQVRDQTVLITDPEIDEYINLLGYRLVANSEYRRGTFHFFVVKSRMINAFAGPAGHIGVNSGLITSADSESELAGVIAHEISHVGQHHLDRAFDTAEKLSLSTAGAIIAAILLGSRDILLAEAAIAATMAANIQTQLNFTRAHEREADFVGIQILQRTGYDPRAMSAFFERLSQNDRLYDNEVPEFLRTHPVTTDRIAEARGRAERYLPLTKPEDNGIMFHLMRAKIQVYSDDNAKQLAKTFAKQIEDKRYPNRYAALYGYALAQMGSGQMDRARATLDQLIKEDQERIPYLIARAQINVVDGKTEAALSTYREALKLNPRNTPLTRYFINALVQSAHWEEARAVLSQELSHHPEHAYLYQAQAKVEGETGHPGAAHRAMAEFYALDGQPLASIEQLTFALRQPDLTPDQRTQVESRLTQLRKKITEERQRTNAPNSSN